VLTTFGNCREFANNSAKQRIRLGVPGTYYRVVVSYSGYQPFYGIWLEHAVIVAACICQFPVWEHPSKLMVILSPEF